MDYIELKKDIHWIGTVDRDLKEFDVVLESKWGTTYNSYLVKGSKKTALIDTVKYVKIDEYLNKLNELIDIKDIDYIIVNHAEPDHTGSIARLLELNPDLIVVGSKRAILNVQEITNMSFESIDVKGGSTLDLGNKTFTFFSAIMLHWPDALYSYLIEDKVLFSCDSFGAHYALDVPLQSKISDQEEYMEAFHYYYKHIFGPFKNFYVSAINRIENLELDLVCPGHGPILDEDPQKVIAYSKKLSLEVHKNERPLVVIPYVTSYGYTEILANKMAIQMRKEAFDVEVYNMTFEDRDMVVERMKIADGIFIGSPTMLGGALLPIWDLLIRINPFEDGIKKGSVFGSYGWSGEGITHIVTRLEQLKMKTIPAFKLLFKPSDKEFDDFEEYVASCIELIKK